MSIQDLLGHTPVSSFIGNYFLKQPYSHAQGCLHLVPLGSWDTVERVLADSNGDIMVVRQGVQHDKGPIASLAEARALGAEGYTLLVRHAERHDEQIAVLARGFRADFQAAVDVHLYCTPANQFGFGWHYDAEDVFILQTSGTKEYWLRKNTVNPWPLVETIPPDMGYQHEIMPMMRCTLKAGDWLYIPAGYWHRAESREDSISLAVGIMAPVAIDLYDRLRPRLLASLRWRQRLPIATGTLASADAAEQYAAICEDLGRDLLSLLTDPEIVGDLLAHRGVKSHENCVTSGQSAANL